MKLTRFTDYSLRVLLYLAAEPSRRATIAEIARGFGVSEHHLVKVVHFLGREGFVDTLRGKGGGLRLARPAASIQVGDVVRVTEGSAVPADCFPDGGARCALEGACGLQRALGEAMAAFLAVLDRHSLADLLHRPMALDRVLSIRPA